jgi:hypothetical protein
MSGTVTAPDLDSIDLDAIKAGDGTLPGGLSPDLLKKLASNPEVTAQWPA